MLTLFYRPVNTIGMNDATQTLLKAVANYQLAMNTVSAEVHGRIMSAFDRDLDWRIMRSRQDAVKMSPEQRAVLFDATEAVAAALNFPLIDFGQFIVTDCFNNTIVDILVHSVNDNTTISDDPHMAASVRYWEQHVIMPVIDYLALKDNLGILGNEPLIGDAATMERWAKYDGDPKRGMFQTVGSMLAKGFFRSLQKPAATNVVPSSFLGNLVCWGLHAPDHTTKGAIYSLLPILLDNPDYRPSIGVCTTIADYTPGTIKRVPIDIVRDNQVGLRDLRDVDVPNTDPVWQSDFLSLAKHICCTKDPLTIMDDAMPQVTGAVAKAVTA
jgi:hypothetical protein